METNEIKAVEEIMNPAEEFVNAKAFGTKCIVGFGVGVLVGVLAAKYIIAPAFRKIKATKEPRTDDVEVEVTIDDGDDETE